MRIAHLGPALARRGGPSGYLLQLSLAADRFGGASPHALTFPAHEAQLTSPPPTVADRIRATLRPLKRAIVGPPRFYRPPEEDLRRAGGAVDELLAASRQAVLADASDSVEAALAGNADVLVAHDPSIAERLLERRRQGQQVWLMMHAPMPFGLDLTWSWSVPEWSWEQVLTLPDVAHWIGWEVGVCAAVDRLITRAPRRSPNWLAPIAASPSCHSTTSSPAPNRASGGSPPTAARSCAPAGSCRSGCPSRCF